AGGHARALRASVVQPVLTWHSSAIVITARPSAYGGQAGSSAWFGSPLRASASQASLTTGASRRAAVLLSVAGCTSGVSNGHDRSTRCPALSESPSTAVSHANSNT